MNRLQRDIGRKPVDDFMEAVTDHMDLNFEEKQFLHEEAHNIYNKAFVKGQDSKLQELADEVDQIDELEFTTSTDVKRRALQIINKHIDNE